MVAYAVHGVFIQVWIGTADKLPRRARAVYRDDPLRLRHQVDFSNWKLGVATPVGAFTSVRAAKANRIPFAHPDSVPLPAGAPPSQAAPPAAGTPSQDKEGARHEEKDGHLARRLPDHLALVRARHTLPTRRPLSRPPAAPPPRPPVFPPP